MKQQGKLIKSQEDYFLYDPEKLIAGTIQVPYQLEYLKLDKSAIEIMLGKVNVNKLAREYGNKVSAEQNKHTLGQYNVIWLCIGSVVGYEFGFNECLELNKEKKWTDKDILDALDNGILMGEESSLNYHEFKIKYLESLSKRELNEWHVEYEVEEIHLGYGDPNDINTENIILKPILDDNGFLQIKLKK